MMGPCEILGEAESNLENQIILRYNCILVNLTTL